MVGVVPINARHSANSVTTTTILDGTIANADVASDAAIAYSKLATLDSTYLIVGSSLGVPTKRAITGDVTIGNTGITAIATGVIINTDVSASAAIAWSKMAALTDAHILVGSGSNVATDVAVSGDITMANDGTVAIATGVIINTDINASAAIALSKLATGTSGNLIVANNSGVPTYVAMSGEATMDSSGVVSIGPTLTADITGNLTGPAGEVLDITGKDGYDVNIKLGDDDGGEDFTVTDVLGVELFNVGSDGLVTLEGGAVLDNSASATELNITEDTVKVTGAFEVTQGVTMGTTKVLTLDMITAIATKDLLISGAAAADVDVKLGDNAGARTFNIQDSDGADVLIVDSNGQLTLQNGTTINPGAAGTTTITEDAIALTGAVTITGATVADAITADSLTGTASADFVAAAPAGQDIKVKIGDNAGSNTFDVLDSDAAAVMSVNSDGGITLVGGATITDPTDTITITEDNIALVGATAVTGAATVSTTLGVTGVTTTTGGLDTVHTTPGIGKTDKLATYIYDYDVDHTSFTFEAGDVTAGSDIVTKVGHGLVTGTTVDLTTSAADLPDPLAVDTVYYVNVNGNDLKFYDTYANAVAGAAGGLVDLTDGGSGTHTIHSNRFGEVRLGLTGFSGGAALPDNAIVIGGGIDVVTAFTDDDAGSNNTSALMFNGANDFFSAANWTAALKDAVPDETFSSGIKMTAATYPVLTIAADQVGAGKAVIYVRYVQSV